MKLRALSLGIILSLSSITAMTGSNHDHGHGHSHSYAPVNQATAKTNATTFVADLVKNNKLEKSWTSVTADSIDKKVFKGSSEWVAVFVNDKITDTNKRKLYVFLTLEGEYIAANFTGN